MAHLMTHKSTSQKSIIEEATREAKSYKNDVDLSRSHLNYNLIDNCTTRKEISARIKNRVEDVLGKNIKKNVKNNMKSLGTWLITLPRELNELSDERKREFFEISLKFVEDRYGKENVVYANVHNDETQPHIHIGIVPVTTSRKTGKLTVSAASCFTRRDLRTFHDDLDEVIAKHFNRKNLIKNGRTKGNYTIEELKERTKNQEKFKAIKEKLTAENELLKINKKQFAEHEKQFENEKNRVKNELSKLIKSVSERETYVNARESILKSKDARLNLRQSVLERNEVKVSKMQENVVTSAIDVNKRKLELDEREKQVNKFLTDVKSYFEKAQKLADAREEHLNARQDVLEQNEAKVLELQEKVVTSSRDVNKRKLELDKRENNLETKAKTIKKLVDELPVFNQKVIRWAEQKPFTERQTTEATVEILNDFVERQKRKIVSDEVVETVQRNVENLEKLDNNKLDALQTIVAERLDEDEMIMTDEDIADLLDNELTL